MPLPRRSFEDFARLLDLCRQEVDVPFATIDMVTERTSRRSSIATRPRTSPDWLFAKGCSQRDGPPSANRSRRRVRLVLSGDSVRIAIVGKTARESVGIGLSEIRSSASYV
jgi:hypothetical protein